MKIDSPPCAAGAHQPRAPCPTSPPLSLPSPPYPRALLPSCILTKGTALPSGPGPWEDVPTSGTHRMALKALSDRLQRAGVTTNTPVQIAARTAPAAVGLTHFTLRGIGARPENRAPFKRFLGVLFCFVFFCPSFLHPFQIKTEKKKKNSREAEPRLPMTVSQRSQSNLPLLRTF